MLAATGDMAPENPFRFSTKFQDDETALLYYGYRCLRTSTGRWVSRDPIGEKGGNALYLFAHNSAQGRYDALGLKTCPQDFETVLLWWQDPVFFSHLDVAAYTFFDGPTPTATLGECPCGQRGGRHFKITDYEVSLTCHTRIRAPYTGQEQVPGSHNMILFHEQLHCANACTCAEKWESKGRELLMACMSKACQAARAAQLDAWISHQRAIQKLADDELECQDYDHLNPPPEWEYCNQIAPDPAQVTRTDLMYQAVATAADATCAQNP